MPHTDDIKVYSNWNIKVKQQVIYLIFNQIVALTTKC